MIEKILVAIDGSDNSVRALNFAFDLAQKFKSKILLLTVVPPLFLPIPSLNVMKSQAITDAYNELEQSFKAVLSNAEEKAKKLGGTNIFTRLEHGNPDEVIVDTAKLGNFDVIVVGSRGLSHRDYALGSVSSRVAEKANCPVIIVK
jgi:nucleotide-binding universal stress UspA family protein